MAGVGPVPVHMDGAMQEQYEQFQEFLGDLKYPPTIDRRDQPRDGSQSDIAITTLSEFDQILDIFLEGCVGSHRCPESFVFCLSASWLSRQPSTQNKGLYTLYVHQGISCEQGGQTFLDKFSPPRRVTYLINHMVTSAHPERRAEGEDISKWELETPASSSVNLNNRVNNKIQTTLLCASIGQMYPATLGFWVLSDKQNDVKDTSEDYDDITVVRLPHKNHNPDIVRAKVEEFLKSKAMQNTDQVVVKPFGPAYTDCKGVTIHSKDDIKRIMRAVNAQLAEAEDGMGIVLQAFISTLEPVVTFHLGRHAVNTERMHLGFRVKAIVARTANNRARMTQVVAAINDISMPIGGANTQQVSLETLLRMWGFGDSGMRDDIHRIIRRAAERLMVQLMVQEDQLTDEERGGYGRQTDMVAMDFIITKMNDVVTPVLIGMKDHDCLYQCTVFEMMNRHMLGYAASAFVQIMLARSQRYVMQDKVVLVVGPGGYSRRKLYVDAKSFGMKIVIVDSNPEHPAKNDVYRFLHLVMDDHTRDEEYAKTIVTMVRQALPGVTINGCITFYEDCVPLAAMVGELLEMKHLPSVQAARNAKSKLLTQEILFKCPKEPSYRSPPRIYACLTYTIDSVEDLEEGVKVVPLPAILKLEYGNSAVGVKLVMDMEEAVEHVQYVQRALACDDDHPGIGLAHGKTMILMEWLKGTEHDVDVVMFKGQLMSAFISDNGPTRVPQCSETSAVMPSVLPSEFQHQLINAAGYCCRELGLHTGVYNVEMMMTARGPRLIEINGRMGGFYLRDWIRYVYGVDLMVSAMMCACNIKPTACGPTSMHTASHEMVRDTLMGFMLYPSRHYTALTTMATPDRLQSMHDESDVIVYTQLEPTLEAPPEDIQDEEGFGNLAVKGDNLEDAKNKLIGLCVSLGLETEDELKPILMDFIDPA